MTDADDAQKLSDAVQKLRIAYEQYFAGVERFEPLKERERVKRELRRLLGVRSNNTAYKFKLQSTQATLVTYETHWDRIVRQIEEGTFKRDKLKAQKQLAMRDVTDDVELIEEAAPAPAATNLAPTPARVPVAAQLAAPRPSPGPPPVRNAFADIDADDALKGLEPDDVMDARPTPTAPRPSPTDNRQPTATSRQPSVDGRQPTAAPRQSTAALKPAAPAAGADPIRKLHEAFVAARAQTGETRSVSLEALAETVRKQTAAVKAQMNCENVEFKVAIKDGKAILKAIPR